MIIWLQLKFHVCSVENEETAYRFYLYLFGGCTIRSICITTPWFPLEWIWMKVWRSERASCFGASSGDGRLSSCWTKQIQRWVLFHKIRFANASHLLWKNMWVLRRIVIITSVLLSSTSDSFSPAARQSSFFSSWPDLLKLSLPPSSFSLSSCEYYDGNQISHLMNGELVILVKATACADLVISY